MNDAITRLEALPRGAEEVAYLLRLTGWISRAPKDKALALIGHLANATGTEQLGLKLTPVHLEGPDGPYVSVQMDDQAPVPAQNTKDHISVSRRMWRFQVLKDLHEYLAAITHQEAVSYVQQFVEEGKPVALYLRGFSLGGEEAEVTDPRQQMDVGGSVAIQRHPHDSNFQQLVARCGLGRVVGIANQKDPMPSRVVAQLIVGNDLWIQVVRGLVHICTPIVMFIERPTLGVLIELETILAMKKEAWTVVVHHSAERKFRLDFSGGTKLERPVPDEVMERWTRALAAFPHQLSGTEAEARLPLLIQGILDRGDRPWDGEPVVVPIPANYGAPTQLAEEACEQADMLIAGGVFKLATGDADEAEDLFYRALVRVVFGNARNYLPDVYYWIGLILERRGRLDECVPLYEWSFASARTVGNDAVAEQAQARLSHIQHIAK